MQFDALTSVASGIEAAAAARIRHLHMSYTTALLVLGVLVTLGVIYGYGAHARAVAVLDARNHEEARAIEAQSALGQQWKKIADARAESLAVKVTTVREIIRRTKIDTVRIPVAPAAAQDGVTYSAVPMVPVEVVQRAAFDSLGRACTRVTQDCDAVVAAKDSVIAHDSLRAIALLALNTTVAKQLRLEKHATLWAKLLYGVGGMILGRATASIR